MLVFFFKQKTAYEVRISDWSSDVCSSDLVAAWFECEDVRVVTRRLVGNIFARDAARIEQVLDEALYEPFVVSAVELQLGVDLGIALDQLGRASCRERVCQYG